MTTTNEEQAFIDCLAEGMEQDGISEKRGKRLIMDFFFAVRATHSKALEAAARVAAEYDIPDQAARLGIAEAILSLKEKPL